MNAGWYFQKNHGNLWKGWAWPYLWGPFCLHPISFSWTRCSWQVWLLPLHLGHHACNIHGLQRSVRSPELLWAQPPFVINSRESCSFRILPLPWSPRPFVSWAPSLGLLHLSPSQLPLLPLCFALSLVSAEIRAQEMIPALGSYSLSFVLCLLPVLGSSLSVRLNSILAKNREMLVSTFAPGSSL